MNVNKVLLLKQLEKDRRKRTCRIIVSQKDVATVRTCVRRSIRNQCPYSITLVLYVK